VNNNLSKIRDGLQALTGAAPQIRNGTVVAGSVNNTTNTCDVLLFGGPVMTEVLLSAVSDSANGIICYPKDNSDVVIGCTNGAGQWAILVCSEFDQYKVVATDVKLLISESGIQLTKGMTSVNISDLVKIAASSESLHAILTDLVNAIAVLTVGTPSGTSTVPANVSAFTALLPRINNLLSP